MLPSLISVIIPTFKEEAYVARTMNGLKSQVLFPNVELIFADYDPDQTGATANAIMNAAKSLKIEQQVKVVHVDGPGIGYARHQGALAANSNVLVSFDADAYFSRRDSLFRLAMPVVSGDYLMTCCNNVPGGAEEYKDRKIRIFADAIYEAANTLTSQGLYFAYEAGFTINKGVYFQLGGFPNITVGEGTVLDMKFRLNYPPTKRAHISDVDIIVSNRRVKKLDDWNGDPLNFVKIAAGLINYKNAVRNDDMIPVI